MLASAVLLLYYGFGIGHIAYAFLAINAAALFYALTVFNRSFFKLSHSLSHISAGTLKSIMVVALPFFLSEALGK